MHIRVLVAAAAAISVAGPAAHAATFMPATIQATCLTNCFDQTHTYKQTIAASSFSGPVSIGSFTIDRSLLGRDYQSSVFHVTFWTADGHEVGDFGRYAVGGMAGGEQLTLRGPSFDYDPSLGALTMKIELDGFAAGGAGGGFGFSPGAPSSDRDDSGSTGVVVENFGPGFTPPGLANGPPQLAVIVPEPAAWALMLLGFGGAGAVLRKRRAQAA